MNIVYRIFNAKGDLLYVGRSSRGLDRLAQHADDKSWWTEVARVDLTHFDTELEAVRAERVAIEEEAPRYNKQPGNASARRDLSPLDVTASDRLRALRIDAGMTPETLGESIGISGRTIRRLENGQRPTVRTAYSIASYFGQQTTDIWPLSEAAA